MLETGICSASSPNSEMSWALTVHESCIHV